MIAASQVSGKIRRIRLRPIALPAEHGGWGLLFEPIVLGLLLTPSLAGLLLSVAATGAFLARHPFKLAIGDWRRNRNSRRSVLARRFAVLYFVIATLALALAIKISGGGLLLPLILAAPIVLIQLFYDSLGRSRALVAELAGSISTGALATAIALAGNWPRPAAFGLWAILVLRNVPTILYLRARLRLLRHKPASPLIAIVAHIVAILIVIVLAWASVVPFLAVAAVVILFLRSLIGFLRFDREVTAKKLGLRELCFGAITVFIVVLGHFMWW